MAKFLVLLSFPAIAMSIAASGQESYQREANKDRLSPAIFVEFIVAKRFAGGEVDILSHQQTILYENQTAALNVTKHVPTGSGCGARFTTSGIFRTSDNYGLDLTGMELQVTVKLLPDGKVQARLSPELLSVAPVKLADGWIADIQRQRLGNAVATAQEGQTVVTQGMKLSERKCIQKQIVHLVDLPVIGPIFSWKTHRQLESEIFVLFTAHAITTREEADRIVSGQSEKTEQIDQSQIKQLLP